jgi:Cytochrome c oxidase assembly protein COX16
MDVWNFLLGNKRNLAVENRGGALIDGPALRATSTWPCPSIGGRYALQGALRPIMTTFPSRPLNKSPLHRRLKKHPALFGVPFLLVMVGASFGLQAFTQTRYDLHSQKVTQVRTTPPLTSSICIYLFMFTIRFLLGSFVHR